MVNCNCVETSVAGLGLHRVRFAAAQTPKPGDVKTNGKDGLKYVWVPAGKFTQGCSPGDKECYLDEFPTRDITLTRGFWLGQTEVTQAAYQKIAKDNPSVFDGPDLPVDMVEWEDADYYCSQVGGRLPTEAEWEYSARAGTKGSRYGNLDDIAWYWKNSNFTTHPVGQKKPNAFGLYDMLGNVVEWTYTWYTVQHSQEDIKSQRAGRRGVQSRLRGDGGWWDDRTSSGRCVPQPDRTRRYRLQHRLSLRVMDQAQRSENAAEAACTYFLSGSANT